MVRTVSTTVKGAIFARMYPGEDIIKTIEKVAADHGVKSGQLSLIGAVSIATLRWFNRVSGEYNEFVVDRDLEIVSCMGNIARTRDGDLVVHAHMIAADEDGKCYGGHLAPGCEVSVVAELVILEMEEDIFRVRDEVTGLGLMDL
ncbi:MAG: PPC domain-containing DNA-binding protein [Candidatus Thorarchaeota archaeon]|jgi:predicted DNA-binding protein with PD1-like motif